MIGELVPKQIALRNPEKIAVRVAPAMTAIVILASSITSMPGSIERAAIEG